MSKIKIFILVFLLSFFITQEARAEASIFINEIAWMGTKTSSNDEWIELKNNTDTKIDLNSWRLSSEDGSIDIELTGEIANNGFFLLERTDDNTVPKINADKIYTGTLGNDGEILSLYDSQNNLIDTIDAHSGWPGGDNNTKQTLERLADTTWQTSLIPLGTPRQANSQSNSSEENKNTGSSERTCYSGDVLISEFVADPGDNKNEWIELYNTVYRDISLNNWTIEDGSGTITSLSGKIYKNNFFVVESPKGKLNNSGDTIILRDSNQVIIDEISYGDWDDGNTNDNAPTTADPNSIARRKENYNTRNDSLDFLVTITPTKNTNNLITEPKKEKEKNTTSISPNNIYITEIFPNPIGVDYNDEWLEIYNNSNTKINLENWLIKSSVNQYQLNTSLKAKEYLVISRQDSGLILKNNNETVSLISNKNKTIQKINFKNAPEGYSYNLSSEKDWSWEENISPGKDNIIKIINQAPQVEFYFPEEAEIATQVFFDSSDTYDADSKTLKFLWDFDDGFQNTLSNPEHTFLKSGTFTISLTVSDGENSIKKEKQIKINLKNNLNDNLKSTNSEDIIVTEIMPNPKDDKNNEWIELYNQGNTRINLRNWKLDDNDGGSSAYIFPDFNINENTYQMVSRADSKIILNNDFDQVRLFDPQNNLIEEIDYKNAPAGQSYARGLNDKWFWSLNPTPEKKNIISITAKNSYQNFASLKYENSTPILETPLEEIKNKNINTQITTQGIVIVLPGILSSQFFYINNELSGLQIYNYKKDFGDITLGDLIEVTGNLSQINDEWRLKTKTSQDIKILERNKKIEVEYLACGEINEDYFGKLIYTSGEIIERKGSTLYLDDGTGELAIYIKTGTNIDPKNYQESDYAEITGILSQTSSGIKLMPRSKEDIKIKNNDQESKAENQKLKTLEIPARNSKNNTLKYFLIITITFLSILGITIFRKTKI